MDTIYMLEDDLCDDNPLKLELENDIGVSVAFESLVTIFHGLATTPPKKLQQPEVRQALATRLQDVADVTSISCESLVSSLDNLGTYSAENGFIDAVNVIIEKILAFLATAREWFVKLFKRVFDIRTQQKAQSSQTDQTFKHAKQKTDKDNFPAHVEVTLPGKALVVFHWQKFNPTRGAVYSSDAMFVSLDKVDKQVSVLLTRYQSLTNNILKAVDSILNDIDKDYFQVDMSAIDVLNRNRFMNDLYQNNWECIGMGLVEKKPMSNRSGRTVMPSYGFTNLVDKKGWSGGMVNLKIRTNDFEKLNGDIQKVTDKRLGELVVLNSQLSESKTLKRLTSAINAIKKQVEQSRREKNDQLSSETALYQARLDRLEMVYAYVSRLMDNAYLLSRFYTRYTTSLTTIMSKVAHTLSPN